MNYLVLGGGGFQGRHLCRRLVSKGDRVRVFNKASHNAMLSVDRLTGVEWITGDFEDASAVESALQGVDVIFHLISTTLPKTSNENPVHDVMTNIVPTIRLLEMARQHGVKKVIYFSSGGTVYGTPNTIPITEDHPTLPICSYGIHKCTIEQYLHLYQVLYGLDYAVMRISNPYGPNQGLGRGQGVVAVFLDKLIRGESIEIWGDGSVVRDYVYVGDVIEAALSLVEYQGPHKVFNIGSGQGKSLITLITEIADLLECEPDVTYLPARSLDVPANVLDISRANRELCWRPRMEFRDGLEQLINVIRSPSLIQ